MARSARERIDGDLVSSAIYAALQGELDQIGPFELEEKLTSFHIANGRAFLGVHPRKGGLLINVVLDHPIESPRLHRSKQVSARRWHHEFILTSPAGLDAEFIAWIAEAHDLTTPTA